MKFLADVNIESVIVKYLRSSGYDVRWIMEDDPFLTDEEILLISFNEKRVLLINDKDFGELVFKENKNIFSVILLRIEQNDIELKINIIENILSNYKDKIEDKFIVANRNKIRFINF